MKKPKSLTRNPLALAFGLAIKKMRGNSSSTSIAETLGVSNSFVRLLETGAANIHSSKALKFIEAFSEVEFQPLSRLMVVTTITDGFTESTEKYRTGLSDIAGQLKEEKSLEDKKLLILLKDLSTAIEEYETGTTDIEEILETINLPEKIKAFLTRSIHGFLEINEFDGDFHEDKKDSYDLQFENTLNETPSIFVDTLSLSAQNLKNINPNFFAHDSSEWEKENSQNFVRLVAVIKDFDKILSPANIRGFNYKYLLSDNFNELNYIILNQEGSSETWEKKFKTTLIKRWGQNNSKVPEKKFITNGIAKIKIKQASEDDVLVQKILNYQSIEMKREIMWIFVTVRGNKIGFALNNIQSVPQSDIHYGETLSYKEARIKHNQFNSLWKKLK